MREPQRCWTVGAAASRDYICSCGGATALLDRQVSTGCVVILLIFIAEPAVAKLMRLLAACPDITLRTVAYLNTFCSKTAHTVDIGCLNRSSVHFRPLYRSFFPQCLVIGSVCDECGTFSTDDTARSNYSAHGFPFQNDFRIPCKPDG